jgi:hypothetical protein
MRGMWRKPVVVGAWMALIGGAGPVGLVAQGAVEDEVLAVVTTLFDGMREKDEAKLRSVFHADARLHNAEAPDQGTPIESFLQNLLASPAELDEVTFDEQVLVDGALAVAWTPYNFFADGEFSHCGVDAFTMVRTPAGWKILQIVDTRVREGCDPSRRG